MDEYDKIDESSNTPTLLSGKPTSEHTPKKKEHKNSSDLSDKALQKKKKKIKLIAGAAAFVILPIFMVLLFSTDSSSTYGNDAIKNASSGGNASDTFNDFYDYCEEIECSEEQLKVLDSQSKFFNELEKVGKKYNLSDKQKLIIYETIIFGYDADELMLGVNFETDEEDTNSEDNNTENVYEEEKNTIGFLADKFNGSDETYYNYLLEENYFDNRENYFEEFEDYAKRKNITSSISSWSDEDKEAVRSDIINAIKSKVEIEYPEEDEEKPQTVLISNNQYYWWPIGPSSVSQLLEKNQYFTYYYEEPLYKEIISGFGYRDHPIRHEPALHSGIDIPAIINTAVIASQSGVVTDVNDTCATKNSSGCGNTLGNYIEIETNQGYKTIYEHLAKETIMVKKGDKVSQGQLIAGVGSSGDVTGPHLHFTIKINGQPVNPLDYVDPNNPRPKSSGLFNYNYSSYSSTEFVTLLKNYYSREKVCNSSSEQHRNGCNSFKNEILYSNGASIIYEVASSYNINPELVVVRSMIEGYSPGTYYNYFGFACYNTAGINACTKFSSFRSSMNSFFKNLSRYTSLENMADHYAYIGDYWYTKRSWGLGGCIYAEYIYPDGIPNRVKEACAHSEDYCTKSNTKNCVKTTDEDKAAFTAYQVKKMEEVAEKVFG